jgi:tripartite-type tricarboxylate transporter receptor subunit TctC
LQGGKVRGIAVTTPERLSAFPDIPSVVEAGFPDLDIRFWMGLLAPAGTPAPIVKRLESEVLRIIKLPDVAAQLRNRQVEPVGMGSEEFGKFIASEITRWDGVRKAANIPTAD